MKKPKPVVPVVFETAMGWLRAGKPIRRRAWHPTSKVFRLGPDVFVQLPHSLSRHPEVWKPYPEDFLAQDWLQA